MQTVITAATVTIIKKIIFKLFDKTTKILSRLIFYIGFIVLYINKLKGWC